MIGKETSAPFNTVKEREVHDHVDNIPGPGHYSKQYEVNENRLSSANPNNSFKSKVNRFAPMAPGSTVFKTASSFFNPGPGSYFKKVQWDRKPMLLETREKYCKKQHKSMLVQHKPIPPSIPMKKLQPNSHTGKGIDKPGPSNYNPNHELVKITNRTSDFSK
jgi:hypothetical protein